MNGHRLDQTAIAARPSSPPKTCTVATKTEDNRASTTPTDSSDVFSLGSILTALTSYFPFITPRRALPGTPGARPTRDNPFYRSDMTFEIAAQSMVLYLQESSDWLTYWHRTIPSEQLVEIARKPTSALNTIFRNLGWTDEFLALGRKGVYLTLLPDEFFADVLPLVEESVEKLGQLSRWKGCESLRQKGQVPARSVLRRLKAIRARRVEVAKAEAGTKKARSKRQSLLPESWLVAKPKTNAQREESTGRT